MAPQTDIWTIGRCLNWVTGYLERAGDERARLSAEWLLARVTGKTRVELYTNFDEVLTKGELSDLRSAVKRRRDGEPLQYITGEMPFRHIVVRCEPQVLIPRPETEILVEAALEGVDRAGTVPASAALRQDGASAVPASSRGGDGDADGDGDGGDDSDAGKTNTTRDASRHRVNVLEIGCGSGCVACSIAAERKQAYVVATDLDPKAVNLTRKNAHTLGLSERIMAVQCDLASNIDESLMGTFAVLVSNPPYVPSEVMATLPREVTNFESHFALDGGADGLGVFRRLVKLSQHALAPSGMMCVELFEQSFDDAVRFMHEMGGWTDIEVREDLTHRPRVLVALREC